MHRKPNENKSLIHRAGYYSKITCKGTGSSLASFRKSADTPRSRWSTRLRLDKPMLSCWNSTPRCSGRRTPFQSPCRPCTFRDLHTHWVSACKGLTCREMTPVRIKTEFICCERSLLLSSLFAFPLLVVVDSFGRVMALALVTSLSVDTTYFSASAPGKIRAITYR